MTDHDAGTYSFEHWKLRMMDDLMYGLYVLLILHNCQTELFTNYANLLHLSSANVHFYLRAKAEWRRKY